MVHSIPNFAFVFLDLAHELVGHVAYEKNVQDKEVVNPSWNFRQTLPASNHQTLQLWHGSFIDHQMSQKGRID